MPAGHIIYDDIGSFPKPAGTRMEGMDKESYLALVGQTMEQKLCTGLERPTYPQFRDMIRMFMDPIQDPACTESPYLIRRDAASILELDALDHLASKQPFFGRVCVTGPVELYLSAFGSTRYVDILYLLAQSVSRFLESSLSRRFMVDVASLDEPSLGISPQLAFSEDEVHEALEIAARPCRRIDCEVHLHSPLYAELCCGVDGINVIGVESAAHPDYLALVDPEVLRREDACIRAGIARTDILSLAAALNDRLGQNLWENLPRLETAILQEESPQVMEARLALAVRRFGDRVRYAGPDCGLGSWPSQRMASSLLTNCGQALASFKERRMSG
ncbi:MAG: 5-methyltetrahydropteroyltriglutamate--homocysteine methyltransferase [Methanosaeta sp. PtaB.Bin039]|nr:MAG: 5-methyltetrahydropteroyltriglutamate--homocysteine methyltransferase [Methanosaeta sp. PtaB.Bin039]